jgi:UDP-N-acetylglucosamine 2-epimerase (non-hydrolysing)
MEAFESALTQDRPDWVVVVGDVNSTLACSVVAAKMTMVGDSYVEAGLRSNDWTTEEVNRSHRSTEPSPAHAIARCAREP